MLLPARQRQHVALHSCGACLQYRHCLCRRALTKDVLSKIVRERQTHPQFIWKGGFRDEVCTKHMKEHPWKVPLHCKSNTFIFEKHPK